MPPDARSRQVAAEWMRRARSSLARAKQPKPDEVFWEDLCFDAQQAAEKAVKAVLVFHRIEHPRTHQLSELLALLASAGHAVSEDVWEGDRLSSYAMITRYPGSRDPVDEAEYRRAVAVAETVVRWAEEVIHGV
jgi:HEPN domain-containing protein